MRFVKGISLFFIYPMAMLSLGFAANMAVSEIFYPGEKQEKDIVKREQEISDYAAIEAGYLGNSVVTADTSYVVLSYDMKSGSLMERKEKTPDKYIGLSRERLEEEIKEYGESPSLPDLEK